MIYQLDIRIGDEDFKPYSDSEDASEIDESAQHYIQSRYDVVFAEDLFVCEALKKDFDTFGINSVTIYFKETKAFPKTAVRISYITDLALNLTE